MKVCRWVVAGAVLALVAPAGVWAAGRQADRNQAVASARAAEVAESAKIYGYDLAEGNWAVSQARCAALPGVMLLHYRRVFSDGSESLFTAAAPRSKGRVQIVPVLYHGATPFVPAASNPRNYALFNQLAQQAGSGAGALQLSGCYAELTGGDAGPLPAVKPAFAGAPGPMLHLKLEPESKASSVTLSSQAAPETYQVWSVSFDKKGQVTKARAEYQQAGSGPAAESIPQGKAPGRTEPQAGARTPAVEPGWKYIPQLPDPPSKLVPNTPEPKPMPN